MLYNKANNQGVTMKKYIISSVLLIASATALAQPHNFQGRMDNRHPSPSVEYQKYPPVVREQFQVKVKKEGRNLYRVTHGIKGVGNSPVFLRTDACRIRHGSGVVRLDMDRNRPGHETGILRIYGVQCRVLDTSGLEIPPQRPPHPGMRK